MLSGLKKNSPVLYARKLHKAFHDRPVLQGLDLEARQGELTVLLGPSGCGKTTLLRCLAGLERPDSGNLSVQGRVGMVFQGFHLFPHLDVLENLARAPRVVLGLGRAEAEARARGLLEKVGLASHARHHPLQLSGGQQQRAAIARSLAMAPRVMLYDEPTSALDPSLTRRLSNLLQELRAEGLCQIVVTHDLRFARSCADQVAYLEEGRILELSPANSFFKSPRHPKAKKFLRHAHA
jgi:ABC-type polar amino acid transport system ATPase subunit